MPDASFKIIQKDKQAYFVYTDMQTHNQTSENTYIQPAKFIATTASNLVWYC